jgi:hypothetical protein
LHLSVKTGTVTGVTGGPPDLFDFDQQAVPIAVEAHFFHLLDVTGYFPLEP